MGSVHARRRLRHLGDVVSGEDPGPFPADELAAGLAFLERHGAPRVYDLDHPMATQALGRFHARVAALLRNSKPDPTDPQPLDEGEDVEPPLGPLTPEDTAAREAALRLARDRAEPAGGEF